MVAGALAIAACVDGPRGEPLDPAARRALGRSRTLGENLTIHPAAHVLAMHREPVRSFTSIPQGYAIEEFHDEGLLMEGVYTPLDLGAATLMLAVDGSNRSFPELGIREGHHELSHKNDSDAAGVAAFVRAERWFCEQFAYLLASLKKTPDPVRGGTLFDSSLVVWAKEMTA